MQKLKSQSLRATDTVREYRMNSTPKTMRSQISKIGVDVALITEVIELYNYVAKWNNISIVHIASNYNTHHLHVNKCKRRVKGATLEITQPHLIAHCNKEMGGVYLLDLFPSLYRPTIRGKKW